jgi:hypothetical protein
MLQLIQGKGHRRAFMDFLSAALVPLCAPLEDYASGQDAVGTPGLHEEQEGYSLQQNYGSL